MVKQISIFLVNRLTSIIIATHNSLGIVQTTIREPGDIKSNWYVEEEIFTKEANHKTNYTILSNV